MPLGLSIPSTATLPLHCEAKSWLVSSSPPHKADQNLPSQLRFKKKGKIFWGGWGMKGKILKTASWSHSTELSLFTASRWPGLGYFRAKLAVLAA